MTDDLIINIRERNTSECVPPNYRLEVVDGKRIIIALERIADALEATAPETYNSSNMKEIQCEAVMHYLEKRLEFAQQVSMSYIGSNNEQKEDREDIIVLTHLINEVKEGVFQRRANRFTTDKKDRMLNYCPACGALLQTTTVNIGFNTDSTLEKQAMEIQAIKYCSCGFVKNVGTE